MSETIDPRDDVAPPPPAWQDRAYFRLLLLGEPLPIDPNAWLSDSLADDPEADHATEDGYPTTREETEL